MSINEKINVVGTASEKPQVLTEAGSTSAIVKALTDIILKQVSMMITFLDLMTFANKIQNNKANQMLETSKEIASGQKNFRIMNAVCMGVVMLGMLSLAGASVPKQGVEPTLLNKFHGALASMGRNATQTGIASKGLLQLYYKPKEAILKAKNEKTQAVKDTAKSVSDDHKNSYDKIAQVLKDVSAAIQRVIEREGQSRIVS